MPPINDLPQLPAGIYALTANAELAVCDEHHRLHVDAELSSALSQHLQGFLRGYLKNPQATDQRVAILYGARQAQPWGPLTLSFEDQVVSDLYPAGGRLNGLTAFQKKNKIKSIYRGMELLLERRRDSAPDMPLYCPVLFDAHSTLAGRAACLGREPQAEEQEIRVYDVLNLITALPSSLRASPAFGQLLARLRQNLIRTDQRRDPSFTLADYQTTATQAAPAGDAFADIARDHRLDRQVTLPSVDARRLHESDRIDSIERWLRLPNVAIDVSHLRRFVHFRDVDDGRLANIASRSLVYTAPNGVPLLERGIHDAWNLYLLEGTLMLTAADGATLRVEGGSDKAFYPIAFLKPRKYQVGTLSQVSFLWVHDLLLQAVLGNTLPAIS